MGRKRKLETESESAESESTTTLRIADEPADEATTCDDPPIIGDVDWDDPASNRVAVVGEVETPTAETVVADPYSRIRGIIDTIANGDPVATFKNTESPESILARLWLREIQDQNQKVQIAFAELEAAKMVTKTKKATHDDEVHKLTKLIADQKQMQDDWSRPLPLFDAANGPVNQATGGSVNGSTVEQSAGEQETDSWKFASIAELYLPGKLPEILEENGITTIGELEAKRASRDGLLDIKGIGRAKVDLIEDAVTDWLSVQRDAKALASAAVVAVAIGDSDSATEFDDI